MSELQINVTWMTSTTGESDVRETSALVDIHVDGINLTRNQDVWAQTVRDNVFVSAYPLAMWLASSWWRLNFELLPVRAPDCNWRMAHELGAANHGFVWPRIIFIPDGQAVYVWAATSSTESQSIRYLQGLEVPRVITLNGFRHGIEDFIREVLARLDARGAPGSNLSHLWSIVQQDCADPESSRRRKLEAQLGFDPEQCPDQTLDAALRWESEVGEPALSELAPALAGSGACPDLSLIEQFVSVQGIVGAPVFAHGDIDRLEQGAPWERAIHDARALRRQFGNVSDPVSDRHLQELLGVASKTQIMQWSAPAGRSPVAVAMPMKGRQLKFVPRRHSPAGRRFELARFLGEHLLCASRDAHWLVSTDLSTFHQKYQRAFAAEFLCPIDSLTSFLSGDFSSYAIEEAAAEFMVGEQTVVGLLLGHGYIHAECHGGMPYRSLA